MGLVFRPRNRTGRAAADADVERPRDEDAVTDCRAEDREDGDEPVRQVGLSVVPEPDPPIS
jgi:hypothetical protein